MNTNDRMEERPMTMEVKINVIDIAYRQLAKFLFEVIGREICYVLPSCAVNKIRETFPPLPNEEITGFKFYE